jgi:hypothetical protein
VLATESGVQALAQQQAPPVVAQEDLLNLRMPGGEEVVESHQKAQQVVVQQVVSAVQVVEDVVVRPGEEVLQGD